MSKSRLGIFAKHWTPGRVKTRLAADIGADRAAQFYLASLRTTLKRLSNLADEHVIGIWPPEMESAFAALLPSQWHVRPQVAGDLGERIQHFFRESFAAGSDRVVLLGTDSPNLPIKHVERALRLLDEHLLVLGPTEDGGYYLIGAYQKIPPILHSMPWSTPELWAASLRQLDAAGWQRGVDYEFLPQWYDVDTHSDLKRLHRELLVEAIGDEMLTMLRQEVEAALQFEHET